METVQKLASEVLKLPTSQVERQAVKSQLNELYNDWDDICQQVMYNNVDLFAWRISSTNKSKVMSSGTSSL